MKIVSYRTCLFTQTISGLLEREGVPFEIVYFEPSDRDDSWEEANPTAQVPVLIGTGGTSMRDADEILDYLERQFGKAGMQARKDLLALNALPPQTNSAGAPGMCGQSGDGSEPDCCDPAVESCCTPTGCLSNDPDCCGRSVS